jgi:hypothetical protein
VPSRTARKYGNLKSPFGGKIGHRASGHGKMPDELGLHCDDYGAESLLAKTASGNHFPETQLVHE